jgi:hypothetical protein
MKITTHLIGSLLLVSFLTQANAQTAQKRGLTLDGAKKVIAAAVTEARSKNAPGAAIAVVDEGGNLVAVERLDNTFAAGANISIGKARTAALFKRPTKAFKTSSTKAARRWLLCQTSRRCRAECRSRSTVRSSAPSASAARPARNKTKSSPSPARMLWPPFRRKRSKRR